MRKGAVTFGIGIILIVALIVLLQSAFVVSEGEQAIVTEFGEPVREITTGGLNFKVPFTQRVHRFDKRTLEFDGDPDQLVTQDKKLIYIDVFARWRIQEPTKFFKTVTNEAGAQGRLDDIIDSATRTAIAQHPLIEAVRNSNRRLTEDQDILEARRQLVRQIPAVVGEAAVPEDATLPTDVDLSISQGSGREAICREILAASRQGVARFGIELLDVQIKRINYVEQVERRVIDRMISDRQQIAEMLRSEGRERHAEFMGEIEREKSRILSEAYKSAEEIKGEAEAEAARIYAEAYGQDPGFYAFWKALEVYRKTLGSNTTLVIGTDSELFRILQTGGVMAQGGGE